MLNVESVKFKKKTCQNINNHTNVPKERRQIRKTAVKAFKITAHSFLAYCCGRRRRSVFKRKAKHHKGKDPNLCWNFKSPVIWASQRDASELLIDYAFTSRMVPVRGNNTMLAFYIPTLKHIYNLQNHLTYSQISLYTGAYSHYLM